MSSQVTMFEGLLEAMPDALVGVDKQGVIRYVNQPAESLFGYDRDDLVGAPLETLVPESVRKVRKAHREGYSGAPVTRTMGSGLELNGRRRDGTRFPVDIALSAIDTGDGILVIAAVHDMTPYRRAEAERRRLDRLLAIVEYCDDAIIGTTLDGTVTSWNPAAEVTFGYSSGEIIGQSLQRLSLQDHPNEARDLLAKISTGEQIDHFESIRVRKDATPITVSLSVSPIRQADGLIMGASTIARDVTGARGALQAARSMIEASLDSLVSISPEGKITDANEATVKLTGVPREKLIGTSFSQYFTDPSRAEEIYQRVFTEGMAVDYPLTLHHHNGHEMPTEVRYNASVYRDGDGEVLGVFAAARDVTQQTADQRKIAEQQAKALEEQAKGLERLAELEEFQRLTVGRELKMIELKKEIEYLRKFGPTNVGDPGGQY